VLAGPNGGGKSSLMGAMLRAQDAGHFDPDQAARRIRKRNPGLSPEEANSAAWQEGRRLLERAIGERLSYAFETTLGGNTIPALLATAAAQGLEVRVWYVALDGAERHIRRVQARVARGGHDIPEETIRRRYDRSRLNLIRLLPRLTELQLWDNSEEGDPHEGAAPRPRLLLHVEGGRMVEHCELATCPDWAKPILAAVLRG
jgi:predicted ABC-type ATPase